MVITAQLPTRRHHEQPPHLLVSELASSSKLPDDLMLELPDQWDADLCEQFPLSCEEAIPSPEAVVPDVFEAASQPLTPREQRFLRYRSIQVQMVC